jgi:hypothetical protein
VEYWWFCLSDTPENVQPLQELLYLDCRSYPLRKAKHDTISQAVEPNEAGSYLSMFSHIIDSNAVCGISSKAIPSLLEAVNLRSGF